MATECWPDRTLGDNRMWFEAKSEEKKKRKRKEEKVRLVFSGEQHPWIMGTTSHVHYSSFPVQQSDGSAQDLYFTERCGERKRKKKVSIHSFINSNVMRGGERRNQRQWFNCNVIDSWCHEKKKKKKKIFHNKSFIPPLWISADFTLRLIRLCQSTIWHKMEPVWEWLNTCLCSERYKATICRLWSLCIFLKHWFGFTEQHGDRLGPADLNSGSEWNSVVFPASCHVHILFAADLKSALVWTLGAVINQRQKTAHKAFKIKS